MMETARLKAYTMRCYVVRFRSMSTSYDEIHMNYPHANLKVVVYYFRVEKGTYPP